MKLHTIMFLLATLASGCADDDAAGIEPGTVDGPCAAAAHVGGFEIALKETFTSVQGTVTDGVAPNRVGEIVTADGSCSLMKPPTLFCDPQCVAGTTCNSQGACIATPANVSAGTVSVTGLANAVEMTSSAPVFFYTNLGMLAHPAFDEGTHVQLRASGEGAVEAFSLDVKGIAPLEVSATSVLLDTDTPVELSWTAPAQADLATVNIDLNIAQHGGTPGWIECEVADTGSFTIPVALTNQLLSAGFSGFPAVVLTRRSVDSSDTAVGCVQLEATSSVGLDIEIPGLTSCSGPDDCTPPQICRPDLTCG